LPLYEFQEKDGTRHERFYHLSTDCPKVLTAANDPEGELKGSHMARKIIPDHTFRRKQRHAYPILSDALGCHPDDIPDTEAALGCKCTPEGQVEVPSRQEHLRMLKAARMREGERGEKIGV